MLAPDVLEIPEGAVEPAPRPVVDRRTVLPRAVVALGLAGATGMQLAYALMGAGFAWQDTSAYERVAAHPLLSVGFWAGSRPPLIPLLFKATANNHTAFVVVQALAAAAAWGALSWTVFRLIRPGWRAVLAAVIVLAFSLSPYVIEWNASGLTESLSISSVALLVASGLWLTERFSWWRASALVASLVVFCLARDEGIPTALLIGVGVLTLAAGLALRRVGARQALLVGLLIVVAAGACELGALSSQRNLTNLGDDLAIRVFPVHSHLEWFARHGMPQAAQIGRAPIIEYAGGDGTMSAPGTFLDLDAPIWQPLRSWMRSKGALTYLEFLAVHPWWDVSAPFSSSPMTYNSPASLAFYAQPGRHALPATGFVFPVRLVVELEAIVALLLLARRRLLSSQVAVLALLAPLGLFTAMVAWQSDGQEVARHMIEGTIMVRLSVLVLLMIGLFGQRTPAPTGPPADDPSS